MNTDRDLIPELESWLEAGTRRIPARVLNGAMGAVARTPQGRRWLLVSGWERWAGTLTAAAVVIFAVAAIAVFLNPRSADPGGAVATPSPAGSPSPSPGPSPHPVAGTWNAIDVDDSAMTLTLAPRPNGEFDIRLDDPYGSGCDRLGAEVTVYEGIGVAVMHGDDIQVVWTNEHCGDFVLDSPPFVMEYIPESDSIEGMDVTWHRGPAESEAPQ